MALSYFLAQLMGSALVIFALAGLMRPKLIAAAMRDFDESSFSTLAIGFIALIAGLAVVLSHNIWEASWVGLVTLFGWASFLKGTTYLVAPQTLLSFAKPFWGNPTTTRVTLFVALLVGVYLAYSGFGY